MIYNLNKLLPANVLCGCVARGLCRGTSAPYYNTVIIVIVCTRLTLRNLATNGNDVNDPRETLSFQGILDVRNNYMNHGTPPWKNCSLHRI